MEMSVSSEMTFFTTKQQSEICPHLRTGSSAEDRGRIDTSHSSMKHTYVELKAHNFSIILIETIYIQTKLYWYQLTIHSPSFLLSVSRYLGI